MGGKWNKISFFPYRKQAKFKLLIKNIVFLFFCTFIRKRIKIFYVSVMHYVPLIEG